MPAETLTPTNAADTKHRACTFDQQKHPLLFVSAELHSKAVRVEEVGGLARSAGVLG
jgi:hypothetical protein